jgi:hypothetical protein
MTETVSWLSGVCSFPIANLKGGIWIDNGDLHRRRGQIEDAEPAEDFWPKPTDVPELVPWSVTHLRCGSVNAADCYWIEISRIRSVPQVLAWSVHLAKKTWVTQETDWLEFVDERVLRPRGITP